MINTTGRESGCPAEEAWLAYSDGEGDGSLRETMARHLQHCRDCQRTMAGLAKLAALTDQALLGEVPPRFPKRRASARPLVYAGAAAAVILGVVLAASAPARHVLADALTVFQPTRVQSVGIPVGTLRTLMNSLTQNGSVSLDTFGSAHLVRGAAPYSTATGTLTGRTGLPDLWPSSLGPATASVQPAETASFSLNVPRINTWLQSEGATALFPTSLEGESFTVNVPTSAMMQANVSGGYDALVEMTTPSLDVPSGVPVSQVRAAILSLPFLPQNLRTALSAVGNWRQTAVLPLPGNPVNTTFLGNPAVIEPAPNGKSVTVVWIHQGVVAAFTEYRVAGMTVGAFQKDLNRLFS